MGDEDSRFILKTYEICAMTQSIIPKNSNVYIQNTDYKNDYYVKKKLSLNCYYSESIKKMLILPVTITTQSHGPTHRQPTTTTLRLNKCNSTALLDEVAWIGTKFFIPLNHIGVQFFSYFYLFYKLIFLFIN